MEKGSGETRIAGFMYSWRKIEAAAPDKTRWSDKWFMDYVPLGMIRHKSNLIMFHASVK